MAVNIIIKIKFNIYIIKLFLKRMFNRPCHHNFHNNEVVITYCSNVVTTLQLIKQNVYNQC